MNHIYRLIWNTTLACWVVASEHSRSRGKRTRTRALCAAVTVALTLPLPALADDVETGEAETVVLASDEAMMQSPMSSPLMPMMVPAPAMSERTSVQASGVLMWGLAIDQYYRAPTITGEGALLLGSRATLEGAYSTGFGNGAYIRGDYSTALGNTSAALNGDSTAVGAWASAISNGSTALGFRSFAEGRDSLAIGNRAVTTFENAIAVGRLTKAYGTGAVALGNEARALGYSNAIGHQANADNSWANAIGFQAKAMAAGSIAIGYQVEANNAGAVAIGWRTKADGGNSVAIGALSNVDTTANEGVALGREASVGANAFQALAVGKSARANGEASIALGRNALAANASAVALGTQAEAKSAQSLAIGLRAKAEGQSAMGLGMDAQAGGDYATAVGHQAKAANNYANAIGYQAQAAGSSSIAIGSLARSASSGSIAMGDRSNVDATAASSMALGHSAAVGEDARNAVALGSRSVATAANTVSVGSASLKRKIVNVADGEVSSTSTDAVTGRQLNAVNGRLNGTTVALGENARPNGGRAIALGANALVDTGGGNDGIAIGGNSRAGTKGYGGAVAIGGFATADTDGLALGYDAHANAARAVALGRGSVANVANTVSVGSDTIKRKIVNVADGALSAGSNETVTGNQLFATNQNVTMATNTANTAKTAADAAQVDATAALTKANVVSGLIGQNSASGNVRVGGENTGAVLDVRNKANANRTVSGVADGALTGTSSEAVSGRQLFATNQNVTNATTTANTAKAAADTAQVDATSALTKANVVSGLIGQVSASGTVRLGGENTGAVLDVRNKADVNRTVSGVADGALSAASSEAVTGRQLFDTNQEVTTVTATANTAKATADAAQVNAVDALGKANHLNGLVSQAAPNGALRLGGENTGFVVDVRNRNGGTRTLSGVAAGATNASSSEAVNGAQLHGVNERVGVHTAAIAGNRMDIGVNREGLDELRQAFDNFEPDLSGVVQYNADRTLVDLDGAKVAGLAAGEVSASSREAINGSQLFGTNERVGSLEQQQRYVTVGADPSSGSARAAEYGVAVGADATAGAEGSTAIGSFATALGGSSVALGRGSHVSERGVDSFALGTRTRVRAAKSLAIGADSVVLEAASRSVALGNDSVATEADTLSVGNTVLKRRIVNAGKGMLDDDVTTLAQLREAVTALGGGASIDSAGSVIAPRYMLSGGDFNNVGDALTSIDTKLVSHKDELDTLDTRYKALVQNDRSIRYNDDRSVVDFGGSRLTGVAAGSLKADSSDGVNGAQLFATNERVAGVERKQQYVSVGADHLSAPAVAGSLAVAVGGDSKATADGATAVGSFANAHAVNSVALGRGSLVRAGADAGFALGTNTEVLASGGLAVGALSSVGVHARRAVALGNESVATEADSVSVGNDNLKRRIVNLAQGIKSDDATTVSQLRGALAALGGGADLDANGNVIGPRYAVQGSEYGSFGDAITALDGSVGDNKRGLDSLDSRFQRLFQESPSANADAPGRLSFGGAQGMVLGNVANGLVGQGSRDAVNGGQLWAVKQDLQGQIDALDPGKGDVSGSPLAMNARNAPVTPVADSNANASAPDATPPATAPGNAVAQDQLVKAEGDNAVSVGSEGKERSVKHVAEGRADTDAVNVRQLNEAAERANEYTDKAVAGVNQRLDQVDKRINRMAAMSSAQSAMAMNTAGLQTANRLGAGVGYSEGESAMAVGYQRVLTERGSATFSLNGAFTNSGEKSVGVGVGIGW